MPDPRTADPTTTRAPGSWRVDFRRLWTAQTVSAFGSEITGVALPLTAVALLGASALQMGVLAAAVTLPTLLFSFHFGVLVDRTARRWSLLVWANLARMALLGLVPVAWLAGFLSINLLIVIAFAAGAASLCFHITWSAFLPSLVPADNLVAANAKMRTSMTIAGLSGVALAGVLVQLLGAPMAVAVDAASFAVATLFLTRMSHRGQRAAAPTRPRRKMRHEAAEGLQFIRAEPRLRAIAGASVNLNLFSSIVLALFVLYASRELAMPASVIGVLFAVWGIGAVGGAMLAAPIGRRFTPGRTIVGASVVFSVVLFAYPLVDGLPTVLAVVVLAVAGLFLGFSIFLFDIHSVSMRQLITPDELQGRASATMSFLTQGVKPIGALLGGVLGETLGVRGALWVAAAGALTTVLWTCLSPLRSGETPTSAQAEEAEHQDAVLRDSRAQ